MATGENVYPEGSLVRSSEMFTNLAGVLTDPSTVTLEWEVIPNGTGSPGAATTWTYLGAGSIVKDGVGLYHADLDTTGSPGLWKGEWEVPPGSGQTVAPWTFYVLPSQID